MNTEAILDAIIDAIEAKMKPGHFWVAVMTVNVTIGAIVVCLL